MTEALQSCDNDLLMPYTCLVHSNTTSSNCLVGRSQQWYQGDTWKTLTKGVFSPFVRQCLKSKLGLTREARVSRCTGCCCTRGLQVHNTNHLIYLFRTLCNAFYIKIALVVLVNLYCETTVYDHKAHNRQIYTGLNVKLVREDTNILKTANYISSIARC